MTGVSVLFYLPVNILANKVGKKRLLLVAFVIFTCAFAFAGALGSAVLGFIPAMAQGLVLSVVGAIPMAAFGILPQAIVANIADASSKTTGQDRQGHVLRGPHLCDEDGPVRAMLLFTGVSTIGMASGAGYHRHMCAAVLCGLGGIVFAFYNGEEGVGRAGDVMALPGAAAVSMPASVGDFAPSATLNKAAAVSLVSRRSGDLSSSYCAGRRLGRCCAGSGPTGDTETLPCRHACDTSASNCV